MKRLAAILLCLALLAAGKGFAFTTEALQRVDRNLTFSKLQQNPGGAVGKDVILGGTIVALERRRNLTRLEVAELPLAAADRPDDGFGSPGRFLATTPDPLAPRDYRPGYLVTIIGTVKGGAKVTVDGEEYSYPVLAVKEMKLWKEYGSDRGSVPPAGGQVYDTDAEPDYDYDYAYPYPPAPYYYGPYYPWWPWWWVGGSIIIRDHGFRHFDRVPPGSFRGGQEFRRPGGHFSPGPFMRRR
jgi:outer membrane lipoprotein